MHIVIWTQSCTTERYRSDLVSSWTHSYQKLCLTTRTTLIKSQSEVACNHVNTKLCYKTQQVWQILKFLKVFMLQGISRGQSSYCTSSCEQTGHTTEYYRSKPASDCTCHVKKFTILQNTTGQRQSPTARINWDRYVILQDNTGHTQFPTACIHMKNISHYRRTQVYAGVYTAWDHYLSTQLSWSDFLRNKLMP